MVERVARAIFTVAQGEPGELGPDEQFDPADPDCEYWLRSARMAIEAMRESTAEMNDSGANAGGVTEFTDDGYVIDPRVIWAAMIDAALGYPQPLNTEAVNQ
jgi:hypothetical protein